MMTRLFNIIIVISLQDGNEAPVFSSGNHEFEDRVQVDGDLGVIHFRPLIKEDEGEYQCHAFSEAGEDFETGHMTVLSNHCIVSVLVSYQIKCTYFLVINYYFFQY